MKESKDWRVTSSLSPAVWMWIMWEKMLCVDYFLKGDLNITAVYLNIYVFSRIWDAGKDFICQCGNIIFTVGLYKIVESRT